MIDIVSRNECTGCSACIQICPHKCIDFQADTEGFLYPKIDLDKCVHCDLCQRVCPVVNTKEYHPVKKTYGAYNLDEAQRVCSSSGGLFIALCKYYLESLNGVVCGVRMSDDCKKVEYAIVKTLTEVTHLQGSKYLQSYPIGLFNELETKLKNGTHVLFSGTPCQVNAFKRYLNKEYDKLLVVDVICHGVPSPLLWEKYLAEVEKINGAPVTHVNFRCKTQGWKDFGLLVKLQSGQSVFSKMSTDPYMRFFLRNLSLRPSCYNCKSKTYRLSDITLGDFWGINDIAPNFNDNKGISAVIIRTEKGITVFETIRKNLRILNVAYEDIIKHNTSEYVSVAKPNQRDDFFADLGNLNVSQLKKKYLEMPLYKKMYLISINMVKKILRRVLIMNIAY